MDLKYYLTLLNCLHLKGLKALSSHNNFNSVISYMLAQTLEKLKYFG